MNQALISLFERDLDRLRMEIELTSDTDLWRVKPGVTNSIGNLALHLCGNLKHFIGATLGSSGYVREREREFSDKNVSKSKLYTNIEETKAIIVKTISALTQENIKSVYPVKMWNREITTEFFLIHLQSHLNYHLGQINYLRRVFSSE